MVKVGSCGLCTEQFRECFEASSSIEVVYSGLDLQEGLQAALSEQADLAILDMGHPAGCVFETAAEIKRRSKRTKLVFLTASLDPDNIDISRALELRARGILTKAKSCDVLYDRLLRVLSGEHVFTNVVRDRIEYDPERGRYKLREQSALSQLTVRQLEILRHLCDGESVKAVARKLHLSPNSVDCHKYRIMRKVGVNNSVSLVRCAIREGLIEP